MRILQIIDSLEVGGAERMAVNYANSLAGRVAFSGLAATRAEGPLRDELNAGTDMFSFGKNTRLICRRCCAFGSTARSVV